MAKPEVLTTQAVSKIETRFRRLYIDFRGRSEEWNIDRHRDVHARYRILHGDVKFGNMKNVKIGQNFQNNRI